MEQKPHRIEASTRKAQIFQKPLNAEHTSSISDTVPKARFHSTRKIQASTATEDDGTLAVITWQQHGMNATTKPHGSQVSQVVGVHLLLLVVLALLFSGRILVLLVL